MNDLWRHQREAIAAIEAGFQNHDRLQLHMACGTGKTRVAQKIIQRRQDGLTTVLMPTIELMVQTARSTRGLLRDGSEYFYVGAAREGAIDGIPALNDPDEIAQKIARRTIVFSTYASLPHLGEALRAAGRSVDLAIADEAHKTAGLESKLYGYWLSNADFPAAKRLAMTATPRVVRGGVHGLEVYSMDDIDVYGPVAYSYSYAQAVEDGVICDLDALVPIIEGEDTIETRAKALSRAITEHGLRKLMSFHGSVEEAKAFAAALAELGHRAVHVNGRSGRAAVDAVRAELSSSGELIVTNARLFGEGIDVPALDAVFFASFKRSVVDITQQVGRAVRRSPGKERGYVIMPPAKSTDLAMVLESGRFRPLWGVISSLFDMQQMNDERWDYGPRMKIRAVGGAETDNAALGHGIGELIEIRRIGLNDHGFVRTARKVVEYIERGMAPYSNDSPYRTWLAEAGRQANAGDLSQVRLDAWNQVQAAFARRTRERFDALDAYVASVENGARPQGRLTEELRDLSGNPIFAPLYERFEAARGNRRQLQRARAIRLIEALENGGSSMFDPSMYATLIRSSPDGQGMYVDLLPRFQAAVASCSALRPNYRRKKG